MMKTIPLDTSIDYTNWDIKEARSIEMADGEWMFHFEAPKGTRILSSRFHGISTFSLELWWSFEYEKWLPLHECGKKGATSTDPCRSFKAFKSNLRRHPELAAAGRVFLGSRFKGYDIVACWSQELIRGYRIDRIFVDDPQEHMSKLVGSAGL
jgi:hypothetical protein